eukprot:scaffold946_cov168-Amphora_coffeaeformis.AAC.4
MSTLFSNPILVTTGLVANSIVIGAPIWVFFVQSPVLFRWTLPLAAGTVLLSEGLLAVSSDWDIRERSSIKFAGASFLAVLVNSLVIVPKALVAGSKATLKKNNGKSSQVDMAVSGGDASDKSVTKTLHQTVVVFVTIMLVGAVGYVHCVANE